MMDKYMRATLQGAFFFILGMIASKLFTYLYRVIIARFLGVDAYGIISLMLAIIGFVLVFSIAGLNQGIVRLVPYYQGKNDVVKAFSIYFSAQRIVLFLSLFSSIILFVFSEYVALFIFKKPELANFVRIFSVAIPFISLNENVWSLFRASRKAEFVFLSSDLIDKGLRFSFVFVALILGYGLFGTAFAYTASAAVSFIFSWFLAARKVLLGKIKFVPMTPELLRYSLPLMFAGIVGTIFLWTDTVLLGIFKTTTDVGLYNAAIPTAQLITIPAVALVSLFLPNITEMLAKKEEFHLRKFTHTLSRWIYAGSLPIFVLLLLFGREILTVLFGAELSVAYWALALLSFKFLAELPGHISTSIIAAYGKSRLIFRLTLFGTLANFVLNFAMIPVWGIYGAAISTVISTILIVAIALREAKKLSGIVPIQIDVLKPIASSILSSLIIKSIDILLFEATPLHAFLFYGPLFLLLYVLLMLLLRGFSKEDMDLLSIILRKANRRFLSP